MYNNNNLQKKESVSKNKLSLQQKGFSIRLQLMLSFSILIVIVISILAVTTIRIAQKSVLEKVEKHLMDKANDVTHIIDNALKANLEYLATIGRTLFQNKSLTRIEQAILLEKETKESGLTGIYIVDTEGIFYLSNGGTVDVSDREYYKSCMNGKPFVSEPYKDRVTNDLCISIASPFHNDNGEIIGILLCDFDGLLLSNYIKDIVVGETGFCYILGKSGTIIAAPKEKEKDVLNQTNIIQLSKTDDSFSGVANFMQNVLSSEEGHIRFYESLGEDVIASFDKMETTGWKVVVKAPEHDFLRTIDKLRIFIIVFSVIILAISLVIIFFISGEISKPISKIAFFLKSISEGNLNTNIGDNTNSNSEIGLLARSLYSMVEKLQSIVLEINQNSETLTNASSQVSNTSYELSQRASQQAASTEEVSSTMEQMQANISQNTNNAKITEQISLSVQKSTSEVAEKAQESAKAQNIINEKIEIINDIAFQTNILALNAAVEAARAGEHGKGFAVVAAEVRKLAERSKLAADEIILLSKNAKDLSDKAGESLLDIIPNIEKTADLVKEITVASIEQSSGAEQVSNSIQHLNQTAQHNASASEELATTSEDMTAQANQLKKTVSYFKLY